jgi:hypothetical protein
MKRIFTLFIAIILASGISAQAPLKMSYQAVIRNSSNALVASTSVRMRISILQGTSAGTPVYIETQTPTTNINGLVTIEIGGGTIVTGTFSGIDWSTGTYFIKTETDPAGGTNYTISGVSQILSVPYALYANKAGGHYIGELYGGGIVVAIWKINGVDHGLIASLTDLSDAAMWTASTYQSVTVPEGATSPVDGLVNSDAIVAQAGNGETYAAGLCRAYSATGDGGLNDWYLPSTWELNLCHDAAFVVNTVLGATNGFQYASYWTSTERSSIYAWWQEFNENGTDHASYTSKNLYIRVRAVRKF